MIYYEKKKNMLCYDKGDIRSLFESPSRESLYEEVLRTGLSSEEIKNDSDKMNQIVGCVKIINDKEDIEIFSTLYVFLNFYPEGTRVCYLLKDSINPNKEKIDSLQNFKRSLKENDMTDFILMGEDGCRAFQLKGYSGKGIFTDLLAFIKEKLKKYGNDLTGVNLLISLRGGGELEASIFEKIHKELKKMNLRGDGHVLVYYNDAAKFDVIKTVFPILGTTRKEHKYLSA